MALLTGFAGRFERRHIMPLREEMDWLRAQLEGLEKQLDFINMRELNGALLSMPDHFSDPELAALRLRIIAKMDVCTDKMILLHKQLNTTSPSD